MTLFDILMTCILSSSLGHSYWRYMIEDQESAQHIRARAMHK